MHVEGVDSTMNALAIGEQLRQAQHYLQHAQFAQADQLCRQLVQTAPDEPQAWAILGHACKALGKIDESITHYTRSLEQEPRQPRLLNTLGIVYAQRREFSSAEQAFRQAIQWEPDYAKAFNNLGNILSEQGKLDDALAAYERSQEFGYRDAALYDNLAQVYHRRGDARRAEIQLQKALRQRPNDPELLKRLGMILINLVQFDAAIACFRQVLRDSPDDADAHWKLGGAFTGQGFLDQAIDAFRTAIRLQPANATYQHHLGAALMQRGDLQEALSCYRQAIELDSTDAPIHSSLLFCLTYESSARPEEVLDEHRRWARIHAPTPELIAPPHLDPNPDRPLRVGYISPDFRGHPVGRFIEPAIMYHDPRVIELYCYDEYVRPPDALTARLQKQVSHWRNIRGLSHEQLAEQIRADRIDILVDLAGHTANTRLQTLARKPAPIQVTYLGYPNTTGMDAIDYLLTDAIADPPDAPCYLTEEPIRLPTGFCCVQPRGDVPGVSPLPGLANGFITFGCLHGQSKLNAHVLNLWADLLRAVPSGKLLFARHSMVGEARERLVRMFRERGIGEDRLLFRQLTAGSGEYWHVYRDVDISLDAFPWTGHTTSCESLWMGVPVVTLRGTMHAGRMVASVLTHAGLSEWIANSPSEYIEIAQSWCQRVNELAQLRSGMRAMLQRFPLCDGPGYARGLEAAYRSMWHRYLATQQTDQGSVSVLPPSHSLPPSEEVRHLLLKAEQLRLINGWTEAEHVYQELLAADPESVDGWVALAEACKAQTRWPEAAAHYRRALELRPQVPRIWNSLGIVLARQRLFSEAEGAFRQAVELDPDYAKGFNNLGNVCAELGRFDEAITAYRQALALGFDEASLHENLANLLNRQGIYPDAETHYALAFRRNPENVNLLRSRSDVLIKLKRSAEAVTCLQRWVRINPNDADGHWRLGNALTDLGQLHEAMRSYQEALRVQPNNAAFLHHLGTARMMAGHITEATQCYRQAMAALPHNRLSHASLLFVNCYDPDADPAEVFAEHCRWGQLYAPLPSPLAEFRNERQPDRRLRIGYVSPDFRGHPVGRFIEPLLMNHDPNHVEIFCYDEFLRPPDSLTARFQEKVPHWRNTRNRPDEEVVAQIRADRIDILVDLAGHTGSNRLGIFARKAAPIQVTYLGYPNTTGLEGIDYVLTDAIADPPDAPHYFVEQPLRLPGGFCCLLPRDHAPPVLPLPALRRAGVTFGSLHNQAKLNPRVLDLWAELLRQVTDSRLLLARHTFYDEARAELLDHFTARGVPPDRIEVRQLPSGGGNFWEVYQEVDISLDPFPWTGHTTACESLWMGVPVITLRGTTHAGRMVASVLTHAGLPEWVASSPEEYIRLAQQWAQRIPELDQLREGMRERLRASTLCNAIGFTRQVEAAYRDVWQRWCAGAKT